MPSPSRALTLSALALCLAGSLPAQDQSLGERRMNLPYRKSLQALGGHDRADLRQDWNRYFFGGDPTPEYLAYKSRLAAEELARWSDIRALPAIPGSSSTWINLGPKANLISANYPDIDSGRPVDIATHPSNPQILYLATSGGGIFKCTNADLDASGDWTWTPITDGLPSSGSSGNVSIGALAMSPADASGNTLFVGLGDAFDAQGLGLYKTTDGGANWTAATGMGAATRTYDILPLSASIVLVGTNDGLKRSTDGGATFSPVSLGGSAVGQVWSVQAFSATELICTRQGSSSAGSGTIWYSSDAGASWTQAVVSGISNQRRITVATSPASASTAWGIYENASSGTIGAGLLKTTDKGHTWTFIAAPATSGSLFKGIGNQMGSDGSQGFYNHGLAVDPSNVNRVFVGANLALYRTEDGGATWDQFTHWFAHRHVYAHADFHCSAWSKTGPSTLFIGSDGGLCIVRNPAIASASIPTGASSVPSVLSFIDNRRNRGLATHLVYNIGSTTASSPADSRYRVSLGLQDNGTRVRQDEGTGLQNSSTFEDGIGGDGFGTVFHRTNGNQVLGSLYYTQVQRSTNGGTSFTDASVGITESGSSAAPFAPTFALGATSAPDTVYTWVFSKVYQSTNFGSSWTAMNMTGFDTARSIRNVGASASDPNAVAVVTSGGTGFVTYNGGSTWTQFGAIPNNGLNMSYVWFDTSNPATLYAASTAPTAANNHLWKSTNSGSTWTAIDVSNGFPFGIPVYVVQNDPANPSTVLAGTDFGVYRSDNGGTTWSRYGQGLPLVAVRDLYIASDGSFVRAATYGRGAWEITPSAAPAPTLTSFTPTSGTYATPVTLTGTNFTGATSVKFNGTSATFSVTNSTTIATSVPVGATTGTISVTTPGGTATSAGSFTVTVPAPTLTSLNPTSGPAGTSVAVTGTNLAGATALTFNGTASTFTVNSPTSITATVPNGATTGPVSVTTAGGTAVGPTFTVTIPPPPSITSFTATPATILVGGSSTLAWTTTNATSLSISGIGSVTGTSTSVSPATTTTYVLTASNAQGNVTANATVTVRTRDLDGSGGAADVLDMAVMSRAYSGSGVPTTIAAADLDGDGDVDDNDIALFLAGL